jgi:hypothetical protein
MHRHDIFYLTNFTPQPENKLMAKQEIDLLISLINISPDSLLSISTDELEKKTETDIGLKNQHQLCRNLVICKTINYS